MKPTTYVLMHHRNRLLIYIEYIDGERIPINRYSIAEVINMCTRYSTYTAIDLEGLHKRSERSYAELMHASIAVYVEYLVRIYIYKSIQYLVL